MDMLIDARNALGECVVWCERSGRLLWTDILGRALWSHEVASGTTREWRMPERLASFALTSDDNRLLLGLESGLAWWDWRQEEVTHFMPVEADLPTTRLNDGRCDRQGRFVFGTMNEDASRAPIGSFYRLDGALRLERLELPQVAIANSICFSPDGGTMYFCDSLGAAIQCCDYGERPTRVRRFAQLDPCDGEPDGSAVDAAGYVWNALWGASRVVRYAPDGQVERVVPVPAAQPTCCCLGGPELDTLYVVSAAVGLADDTPHAGAVFAARMPGVRGVPEPRFRLL